MDAAHHDVAALSRRRHRLLRRLQGAQQSVARDRAGRDARHHRPERRRQDHDDGRRHRQDAARRGRRRSSTARIDLTRLDEAEIAELGIGRKFQKPTVFEIHTVEDNLAAGAARATARAARDAVLARRAPTQTSRIDEHPRHHPPRRRCATASPAACRTARSNGSRSACCWRRSRSCCWSTSRSPA